jgi:hypothetical protein
MIIPCRFYENFEQILRDMQVWPNLDVYDSSYEC